MAMFCIFGICIPYTVIWPVLVLALKEIWVFFMGGKKSTPPVAGSSSTKKVTTESVQVGEGDVNKSDESTEVIEGGYKGYIESDDHWRDVTNASSKASKSGKKLITFAKFTAKWCKPCKATEPLFLELAESKKDHAVFVHVDVDDHDQIAAENHAVVIPLIVCYKDGEKVDSHTGKDEEQIRLFVEDMLSNHGDKQ